MKIDDMCEHHCVVLCLGPHNISACATGNCLCVVPIPPCMRFVWVCSFVEADVSEFLIAALLMLFVGSKVYVKECSAFNQQRYISDESAELL